MEGFQIASDLYLPGRKRIEGKEMIKERQTSLAPSLTVPGPGQKEAFPFLCARHHPTIIKENCGLCRDQRSLHHYVCLIVQNAQ